MVDYVVASPDGQKFKVSAPEGVTQDEVLRRLQAQKMPPSDPSFASEFLRGVTDPIRGGAQLLSKVVPLSGTSQASGEGVQTEKKVPTGQPDEMTPGRFLGGMVGPAGAIGAAAKVLPEAIGPMARSIGAGALGGALQPVDDPSVPYWQTKNRQIAEGAALGYGFSVAGKAASAGLHSLGDFLVRKYPENINTQAITTILKRIQQDNKHGAPNAQQMLDLVTAANDTGKPLALTDVGGRNLRSLAGHVTRAPGESRAMAELFLVPRDEQAATRLSEDIDKYVSSGTTMHETTEALLAARSAAARPLYQDTDKLQGIWSPRLQEFLENPDVRSGMARGYHIERNTSLAEGRPFNPTMMGVDLDAEGNVKIIRTPNMRVLDMAKQGLDAMIAEQRDPLTGRLSSLGVSLDKMRRAYVSELDGLDKSGVYKKAREAWGGYSSSLDAVRSGRQAFTQSPQENASMLNAMTDGNREFARIGLADILRERLGKAGFNSDESRSIIRNPWMRDQIRPFFRSDEDFNKFVDAVTNENVMAKTKNELIRGSQTADRLAEDQDQGASNMAGGARIARSLVEGRVFSAVSEMWRLHRDVSCRPDPQLNEAIAKILFAPNVGRTPIGQRLTLPPLPPEGNYLAGAARGAHDVVAPALAAGGGEAVQ